MSASLCPDLPKHCFILESR